MRNEEGAGFCAGFFLGAALGAMAAALLTPRSGREVRRQIVDESERLRERAYGTARKMRDRGDEAVEKTRETAREAAEGFKEAAEILRGGKPGALAAPRWALARATLSGQSPSARRRAFASPRRHKGFHPRPSGIDRIGPRVVIGENLVIRK